MSFLSVLSRSRWVFAALATLPVLLVPAPCAAQSGDASQPLESMSFFGASLVPVPTLQAAMRPLLGRPADKTALDAVRRAVQSVYDASGYRLVTVDLPVTVATGAVAVRVHEVRVSTIAVAGAERSGEAGVRVALGALQEGKSPNLDRLAQQTFLFNENTRRQVGIDFQPDGPDRVRALVSVVEQSPWYGSVQADNTGNTQTGRNKLALALGHANLFDHGITAEISASTAPGSYQTHQAAARVNVPVPATGGRVEASVDTSHGNLGVVLGTFAIAGSSRGARLAYQHPLSRAADFEQTASLALEHRRSDDIIDFSGVNLGTSIGTDTLTLAYSAGGRGSLVWSALGSFTVNLPGGAFNNSAAYAASRLGAVAHWSKVNLSGSAFKEWESGWRVRINETGIFDYETLATLTSTSTTTISSRATRDGRQDFSTSGTKTTSNSGESVALLSESSSGGFLVLRTNDDSSTTEQRTSGGRILSLTTIFQDGFVTSERTGSTNRALQVYSPAGQALGSVDISALGDPRFLSVNSAFPLTKGRWIVNVVNSSVAPVTVLLIDETGNKIATIQTAETLSQRNPAQPLLSGGFAIFTDNRGVKTTTVYDRNGNLDPDGARLLTGNSERKLVAGGTDPYDPRAKLVTTVNADNSITASVQDAVTGVADTTGLKIAVCHFPPGTSKWNKIEHWMFCHITRNWRGRPLESHEVIVNLIASPPPGKACAYVPRSTPMRIQPESRSKMQRWQRCV